MLIDLICAVWKGFVYASDDVSLSEPYIDCNKGPHAWGKMCVCVSIIHLLLSYMPMFLRTV